MNATFGSCSALLTLTLTLSICLLLLPGLTTFASAPQYGNAISLYNSSPAPVGVAADNSGDVYWVNYDSGQLLFLPKGATSPAILLSGLNHPAGLAIDSSGNLYYDESFSGNVSELAKGSSTPVVLFNAGGYATFLSVDTDGNLYLVSGPATCNGQNGGSSVLQKFDRSTQSLSTVLSATNGLGGVFVAPSGNLYYTTCSGTVDELLNGSSAPKVLVSGLSPSTGVAVDALGNVFYTVYSVGVYMLPTESSSPILLGTAGSTHYGLAIDNAGNLFYSDNLGAGIFEIPLSSGLVTSTITVTQFTTDTIAQKVTQTSTQTFTSTTQLTQTSTQIQTTQFTQTTRQFFSTQITQTTTQVATVQALGITEVTLIVVIVIVASLAVGLFLSPKRR